MKNSADIINELLANEGINANQLASSMGLGRTQPIYDIMKGKVKRLSETYVNKILSAYPHYNRVWLMTGEGEMIKNSNSNAVAIENPQLIYIPMVSQYAYAGYLSGFSDEEYIDSLPTIPFIGDHAPRGEYMAFEVRGDSMEDGTEESILEGDVLMCRKIKQELWTSKLHIKKWDFVIVHKTEGIFVKRIVAHNIEEGVITIHSLNDIYPDRKMNLSEVAQLFNVIQISRSRRR